MFDVSDVGALIDRVIKMKTDASAVEMISLPMPKGMPGPISVPAMIVPQGKTVQLIKPLIHDHLDHPARITETARLTTLESFVDYIDRFINPNTAVFVSVEGRFPFMVAIIDYHGIGPVPTPDFCQHTAVYNFPFSEPFQAWKVASESLMTQETFASFLQDRSYDIENPPVSWADLAEEELNTVLDLLNIRPDPGAPDAREPGLVVAAGAPIRPDDGVTPRTAIEKLSAIRFGRVQELNALARGVEISVGQKFQQGNDPRTGSRTLTFQEEHGSASAGGTKVVIPEVFLVYISVFFGGPRQLLPVRLYYRVKSGSIQWGVQVIDQKRLIDNAVRNSAETVRNIKPGASLPVYFGVPKS